MGDLFKALSGGLARFVFAWLMPSAVSLGLFWLFVLPSIGPNPIVAPVVAASVNPLGAAATFTFLVFAFSIGFAYSSLHVYRILEGYLLPTWLQKRLRRRHLKRFERTKRIEQRFKATGVLPRGYTTDDLRLWYPPDASIIRATALGNALTTLESWSRYRYNLDSQTMWHELQAVSSANVRQDVDEGRAPVDFYVSSIAHMALLGIVGVVVGLTSPSAPATTVGLIALLSLPLSYRMAVDNMIDWSQSVKAMINVGRRPLADALGMQLPDTLEKEREMWSSELYVIELRDDNHIEAYNQFRKRANNS